MTANLQHPNLLPLFDSGEASGLLFYVLPFVDGDASRAAVPEHMAFAIEKGWKAFG